MNPTRALLAAATLGLAAPAAACPTLANGNPEPLTFDTAQVAISRQGEQTTFTVSVNPQGDPGDFAIVLPVPAILAESDIAVLDTEIFARLNGYTGVLTMPDAGCSSGGGGGDSASDGDGGGGEGGSGVVIEGEYLVGDYEIVILSAVDPEALWTWLTDNDYNVAPVVIPALEQYIEEGMYFMAAKVSPEATAADGTPLPPLQVRYLEEAFSIPLRLAALSSPGEQDMIAYILMDQGMGGGRAGIANYPEFTVPDQCVWGEAGVDDFADFYETRFRPGWEAAGYAAWAVEWAGGWYDCAPCSGVTITEDDILALGYEGDPWGHFLTRVHFRYTPDTADEDIVFYGSGLYESQTQSYADANPSNARCIEACPDSPGEVWMEENGYPRDTGDGADGDGADGGGAGGDGGGDGGVTDDEDDVAGADDDAATEDKGCGGCAGAGAPAGLLGGLAGAALALLRRRRASAELHARV